MGIALACAAMACMMTACSAGSVTGGDGRKDPKVTLTDVAMGTVISITVYPGEGTSEKEGGELAKELFGDVQRLEEETLSRRLETSEVFKLNDRAGEGYVPVSEELLELLEECKTIWKDSDGAFDVSLGPLVELWNVDELAQDETKARLPKEQEIQEAKSRCGSDKLTVTEDGILLEAGMVLDLGSVGKGIALDRIREKLDARSKEDPEKGVAGIFSLGGSILTYGEKPGGNPWKVAVTDPLNPGETIGTLSLTGTWCVSTSGDYERYFVVDGVRYHHLLDPATGSPARSGLCSVTILSKSGFLSDALSTACFVLGKEKGMELAEKWGAEILVVEMDGEAFLSEGFRKVYSQTK